MDSITEAIENDGVDAWEKFGEKGSSVLEDLGKQIAYSLFFSDKFKDYKRIWRKSMDPAKQKKK